MHGQEPWKDFFIRCMQPCSPSLEGEWREDIIWIFTPAHLRTPSFSLMAAILKAWTGSISSFHRVSASSKDEIDRQPIMWNE